VVSWNRGIPSHHPFLFGIFHCKSSWNGVALFQDTSIWINYGYLSGWWFGTFFIFHNIWDNPSHWLSYFSRWLLHHQPVMDVGSMSTAGWYINTLKLCPLENCRCQGHHIPWWSTKMPSPLAELGIRLRPAKAWRWASQKVWPGFVSLWFGLGNRNRE
jgi:hypothetical protein